MIRYPVLEDALRPYGMKAEVARFSGVSESQIGRIAKGESLPSLPLIRKISKCLGISIDALLRDEITNN